MTDPDELFGVATREGAAAAVAKAREAGADLGETKHLQPVMRKRLRGLTGQVVDGTEVKLPLPNWKPRPSGVDIAVRNPGAPMPCYVAELKLRKTDETLWDLFKMIDALSVSEIEAAYLIVGARDTKWKAAGACLEVFHDRGLDEYESARLFADNRKAWLDLLHGGSARPTRVPAHVSTTLVTAAVMDIDGKPGTLKCVRVQPAGSTTLDFDPGWYCGDWPVDVAPADGYMPWRKKHWAFLRLLDVAGRRPKLEAERMAAECGLNLDKDCGFVYAGQPMLEKQAGSVSVAAAGHCFLADWEKELTG